MRSIEQPAPEGASAREAKAAGFLSASDDELVRRCREGSESAWHELVTRHTRRVFGVAYRFCGRVDEAEDLTQEVFVKVYQKLDRYRDRDGAFTTWLTTIARNHSIDLYRRRREERQRRVDDPERIEVAPSTRRGQQAELERNERVELVRSGLRALPPDLREPLMLCDIRGLSYDEAAKTLEIPLGTVKSRINRGRLELARRLMGRRELMEGI
jgi:RNA polymerase sigma-70 factor (ECF subfamily)